MFHKEIFFLGSNRDAAQSVAQHLCADLPENTDSGDLSDTLVLLPGKQAIRSVTNVLAQFRKILLAPAFTTASSFRRMGIPFYGKAPCPLEKKILWMQVLEEVSPGEYPELFPDDFIKNPRTLSSLADPILALYNELETGYGALDFAKANELLQGTDRNFPALARLEKRYREKLEAHSFTEMLHQEFDPLEEACFFLKYRRIVVAASPDLPPFVREKLIRLQQNFELLSSRGNAVPVFQICITAPESWCDCFDSWGCLIPEQWSNVMLPFRPGTIHAVPDVREMADLALRLSLTGNRKEDGTVHWELDCANTALAVTHPAFFPDLEKAYSGIRTEEGACVELYNPDGVSMKNLRLVPFCRSLCALLEGEKISFEALRAFLRQECVLEYFAGKYHISADSILKALDVYFLIRKPDEISLQDLPDPEDLASLGWNHYSSRETACRDLGCLLKVFICIGSFLDRLREKGAFAENLRFLCTEIFSMEFYPDKHSISLDSEAACFREILSGLEKSPLFTALEPVEALRLFTEELSREKLYTEHPETSLEITGFLDMPFRKVTRVILCGMSEGLLPERSNTTGYLNDELRKTLLLPDSDSKYARDCFYVRWLLDRTGGNVHFISPKTNTDHSLLGFSSFYFSGLKNPEEILKRCGVLFGNYPVPEKGLPGKKIPFYAQADLTKAFNSDGKILLNVTSFSSLLSGYLCAALSDIYSMGETAYDFPELDAAVQGTVVHAALQKFILSEEEFRSFRGEDPARKNEVLENSFEVLYNLFLSEVTFRCGRLLPLLPRIQTERWRMRLRKTAEKLLEGSCPVLEREWKLNGGNGIVWKEENVRIKGTIDRIEYDRENNLLRLIDFKTGSAFDPALAHIAGNPGRFINLQLPLYKMLLRQDPLFRKKYPDLDMENIQILCGYFSLSSVIGDIGYHFWTDMDLYDPAAEQTVDQVIRSVKKMLQGILPEVPGKFGKYDPGKLFFPYGYMETFAPALHWETEPEEKVTLPKKEKVSSVSRKKKKEEK